MPAGKELGVTAAAVGHRIRTLERHLDAELFERRRRSVRLNRRGPAARPCRPWASRPRTGAVSAQAPGPSTARAPGKRRVRAPFPQARRLVRDQPARLQTRAPRPASAPRTRARHSSPQVVPAPTVWTRRARRCEEGRIDFSRTTELDGSVLTVDLTTPDGKVLKVNTLRDAIATDNFRPPISNQSGRSWVLKNTARESTSLIYAVVSWDNDDPTDYLAAGWWVHVPVLDPRPDNIGRAIFSSTARRLIRRARPRCRFQAMPTTWASAPHTFWYSLRRSGRRFGRRRPRLGVLQFPHGSREYFYGTRCCECARTLCPCHAGTVRRLDARHPAVRLACALGRA